MAFEGRIGHLEGIESPWGNAGGVVKTVEDVELMAHTGVGWIEAGSYTLEPRVGNSPNGEIVYWHDQTEEATYNSLGMPNKGMDVVEAEIPEMAAIAHAHNKKLVVNVAPVQSMPTTVIETRELVVRAQAAGADAVLVNAGCPNVITEDGGRHELLSRDPTSLLMILAELGHVGLTQHSPVFLRTSPLETIEQTESVAQSIIKSGTVAAVFTPNTWPGYKAVDGAGKPLLEVPGGVGGKSGPYMAGPAQRELTRMVEALNNTGIDVVRSSGIVNAVELKVALGSGAVAGAGTTFFYESKSGWQEDTDRLLSDLAEL
ncbi:hypothetical protein KC950_01405 [Candidatus Saccharibacteria bacterium]|nr:hypothetical protein [Candidatus Saccharibacteria bacterium]